MPGLIDEVFVRIRPEVAGFAAETTAGIRGALAEVNAEVAAGAKANAATAAVEVAANREVADSYLGVADAAKAPIRSMEEIKAAAVEQQATVASVARANVEELIAERDANLKLAASYETIANAAIQGSEQQIAATKLAAEAALRAGVEVNAAAAEQGAAIDGVKSHLLNLGDALGVGFGVAIGLHFVKNIVGGAAESERAVEAIRSRFGAAGRAVVQFGNDAAKSLGVSATLADDTSARFGILFSNLGFGQTQAAQMTIGFEKLAASLSDIKGVDPTQALQDIVSAAAGNTRGLRQLGIVIDATSMKQAIFGKNASLITAPLTAAQRTLAIYRIATRQLGFDMAQVSAHSGDLAFKQRQLSAEFSNAKSALGEALIPVFSKYVGELSDWLDRMQKSGQLQKDFNAIARTAKSVIDGIVGALKGGLTIWHGFADAVGGAKNAVMILIGVMAVSKFASIGNSVINLGGNIAGIGKAAMGAARTFGIATGLIEAESVAAGATIDAALISTGIGALVVAIGVATAYVVTHWDQVRKYTTALGSVMEQVWLGLKEVIVGAVSFIGGSIIQQLIFPMKEFADVSAKAVGWIPFIGDGAKAAANAVDDLFNTVSNLADSGKAQLLHGLGDLSPAKLGQAWQDSINGAAAAPATKHALQQAGGSMGQAVADGVAGATANLTKPLKPVLDAVHNAIESARTKIQNTVMDAKNNLVKIGDDLAKTIEQIQAKIGGAAGAIAGSPQGQAFAKLKHLIEAGAPSFEIARARDALAQQLQGVGKQQPLVKTQLDNLTAAFNKGQITYTQFQARLHTILREDGVTMADALKAGGSAFADTMKAQVSALGQQAKAIEAVPAKFRGIGGAGGAADIKIVRPLQVIQQEQQKIALAAQRQRNEQIRYAREMVKYQANILQEHHAAAARAAGISTARDVPHGYDPRTYGLGASTAANPSGYLTDAEAKKIGAKRIRENEEYWKRHFAMAGRPQDVRPEGPLGPAGAIGTHLSQIHTGIVHETAIATGQHRASIVQLQRISGGVDHLGTRFGAIEQTHVSRPLEVLHQDNETAQEQRSAILRATQRTNAELRSLRRYGLTPGFGKYPQGKGSKDARMGAKTGSRS